MGVDLVQAGGVDVDVGDGQADGADGANGLDLAGLGAGPFEARRPHRSEEHTSELQSLMRISYAVFCLKKKNRKRHNKKMKTAKDKTLDNLDSRKTTQHT